MFPLGAVAVILSLGALFLPSAVGLAAPTAKPSNTAEPTISGQAEQGRTLSASRGSWTGTGSISYAYRWVRCGPDGGRPDASNCGSIPGATRSRYELVGADLGYRLRVRVTASNSEGLRDGRIQPDGDCRRAARERLAPAGERNGARGLGASRCIPVAGSAASPSGSRTRGFAAIAQAGSVSGSAARRVGATG